MKKLFSNSLKTHIKHVNRQQNWLMLMVLVVFGLEMHGAIDRYQNATPSPPVSVAIGWNVRVIAQDLPGIDAVAVGEAGEIYVTEKHRGQLLRLDNGGFSTLVSGLHRPAGLLRIGSKLYIANETDHGEVIEYDLETQRQRLVATMDHPEGLAPRSESSIWVSQDKLLGRLASVDLNTGKQVSENHWLLRPEGLTIHPVTGEIFLAETLTGKILRREGTQWQVAYDSLRDPDHLVFDALGQLWVAEDRENGRLLRCNQGRCESIANGLDSPQGLIPYAGGMLLSEQGRGRLLLFSPLPPPAELGNIF